MPVTLLVDDQRLSSFQFMYITDRHVHGRLNHRAFACQDHDLVVGIIECRTDAPGITHAERLTAPRQPTDHKTTVPQRDTTFQDIRQVDIRLDRMGDLHSLQPFGFIFTVQAFDLTVQTVPYLFQHDEGVGIGTRMLADSCYLFKNILYVSKIEITAKSEVLGSPVVTA